MPLLQGFGELTVNTDINRGKITCFKQCREMRLDGEPNSAPMRDFASSLHCRLNRLENAQQSAAKHFVENGLLRAEIVIDAAGLDLGHVRNLAQSGRRVALLTK